MFFYINGIGHWYLFVYATLQWYYRYRISQITYSLIRILFSVYITEHKRCTEYGTGTDLARHPERCFKTEFLVTSENNG
jgi:hypothetical protein